jgi:NlpC/P60 family putative phage cell wall peptidase
VTPADPAWVVAAARDWLGTPYHDQASVGGVGCDCLGLARGVWREVVGPEPFLIRPYSRDWGETGRTRCWRKALVGR